MLSTGSNFPLEDLVQYLQTLSPLLIYLAVFSIAFVENIFPPFPSDVVIVFAGSLISLGQVGFVEILLLSTVGSTVGFIVMYKIGDWFGDNILEQGKIKFIPVDSVRKVEAWFVKYGYWIIVANRFLAGTRAVVSFFAGMSELDLLKTTALSFFSALLWNAILVSAGLYLGKHWERIGYYLGTYSQVVTGILVLVAIFFVARYFYNKNKVLR
jgi:membrane protein DedA with SNARE-associated domain